MLVEDFVQLLDFEQTREKAGISLYLKLSYSIRSGILAGRIAAGTRLPASRYLAKVLSISRATIVNAYEQLIAEGLVASRPGDGTYVCSNISLPSNDKSEVISQSPVSLFSNRSKALIQPGSILDTENHPLFLPGVADLSIFPDRYWKSIYNRYAHRQMGTTLFKEHLGGYRPLREAISQHLNIARNIDCEPEQVIVMNGLQPATNFIFNLLCDPGDMVMIEEPGYPGVKSAALMTGLKLMPLRLDDAGAVVPQGKPRIIYITPANQFPMGIKMPLARRLQLIEFAETNNCWIIEDDYDNEYPSKSNPAPAMKSLDAHHRIIYSGTFSKVLANYIRVSYLVVPPQLADAMRRATLHIMFDTPIAMQATIADYILEGHFHRHIRRMRSIYARKQNAVVQAIDSEFAGIGRRRGGESGLHTVIELDATVNDSEICREASNYGIGCRPLSDLCLEDPVRGLVLGFGYGEPREITDGIKTLAQLVRQNM